MKKKEKTSQNPKKNRSGLVRDIILNLILIALGAFLVFCPDVGSRAVGLVLGWVLVAIGAISILACLLSWPVMGIGQLIISLALTVFGVVILLNPGSLATIFGYIVACCMVIHGIDNVIDSFKLRKLGGSFLFGLILGIVMAVLGVVLFFVPMAASKVVVFVAGIVLMICGVFSLFHQAWVARKLSKAQAMVVDAEE